MRDVEERKPAAISRFGVFTIGREMFVEIGAQGN